MLSCSCATRNVYKKMPEWASAGCVAAGARLFSGGSKKSGGIAHIPGCGCNACGSITGKSMSERQLQSAATPSPTNHGVVYMEPGKVEIKPIGFPKLELDSTSSPVVSERQKRKVTRGSARGDGPRGDGGGGVVLGVGMQRWGRVGAWGSAQTNLRSKMPLSGRDDGQTVRGG